MRPSGVIEGASILEQEDHLPQKQESLRRRTSAQILEQRRQFGENILLTAQGPSVSAIFFAQWTTIPWSSYFPP